MNIKPVMGATKQASSSSTAGKGNQQGSGEDGGSCVGGDCFPGEEDTWYRSLQLPARAEMVREMLLKKLPLGDIIVLDTRGVSSMYANDGGIIIAV